MNGRSNLGALIGGQQALSDQRAAEIQKEREGMETKTCEVLRTFEHGGMMHQGQVREIEAGFADRLAAGNRPFVRILAGRLPADAETPEGRLPPATTPEDKPSASDLRDRWTLKSSPAVYLKRAPEGPQAELAKELIIAGLGSYTAN
jgi:hypothetical protein